MSRSPFRFKEREVARAIRAAFSAGVQNPVVEIDREGRIRIDCNAKQTPAATEDVTDRI